MTNVQIDFALLKKLDDNDAEAIGDVHSVYGIHKITIAPSLDRITVDYDATRMTPHDVGSILISHGVPVVTSK